MGGGIMDEWYSPSSTKEPQTILLMGHSRNGKTATTNSILGKPGFESGVTNTIECHTTALTNGEVVRVIDTPGLLSFKDIVKCMNLAKDGIHAILVVFSLRGRYTEEDEAVIQSLCAFFGPKITDYMILVFTSGDFLGKDRSCNDYLGPDCSEALKKLLDVCNNRSVIFDNKTKDEMKKAMQLLKLLNLVDELIDENGGKPYTLKEAEAKGGMNQEVMDDEQVKRIMEMVCAEVESKVKDSNKMLQQELADEKAARSQAEKIAQDAMKKSDEEIQMLRNNFLYLFLFLVLFFCIF